MAEAIGVASGLLTLIILAYDTSKSLYEAVSSFKSMRKTIKDVQADLDSLVNVLTAIREQAQRSQEVGRLEPLRHPLWCCAETCKEMREMLDKCKKHSKEGQDSVRVWLNMQYREKSFEDLKQRLASYKLTLIIAFESINANEHSITQDSLKELKDSIHGTKEDLEDQFDQVQQAIYTADASLRDILRADLAQLQSGLDSLEQSQQRADTVTSIVIERNEGAEGSRTLFGTDTSQPKFNLTVSKNKAGLGAIMSAGVHTPETIQALLKDSRTPELALALQALQTQSPSTQAAVLQTLAHNISTENRQRLAGSTTEQSPVGSMISEDKDKMEAVHLAK